MEISSYVHVGLLAANQLLILPSALQRWPVWHHGVFYACISASTIVLLVISIVLATTRQHEAAPEIPLGGLKLVKDIFLRLSLFLIDGFEVPMLLLLAILILTLMND